MTPTQKVTRKRPAVNISLSPRVLELVDKRAKEAGLSRSRIIEAAVLATWGESAD